MSDEPMEDESMKEGSIEEESIEEGSLEDDVWWDAIARADIAVLAAHFPASYADHDGWTAAHVAAQGSPCEVLQWFLESGGDIDQKDAEGDTPLHIAVGNSYLPAVIWLLENGALQDVQNSTGATPLHAACDLENERLVSMLLQSGASVAIVDSDGDSPIHIAARKQNSTILQMILSHAQAPLCAPSPNQRGLTILHLGVQSGVMKSVQVILEFTHSNGIDLANKADGDGDTPLHIAAMYEYLDIVRLLLRAGSNPTIRNRRSQRPSDLSNTDAIQDLLWKAEVDAESR
eukprot:TRINITY_DN5925_c0_g1_i3.p1 TRINITY_DN5925_c0_g1~~TRINITY_DN5925_c0_g1_i3.p1  ORF type:complete len:289 (+),score=63.68 TRINITY_DN5925_c0_g1_i3:44-910(+)